MKERDWDVTLHEQQHAKASTYTPGVDGDSRAGFGAALQAGATGIDPSDENAQYVEHTKQNDAVFESALNSLADRGDSFPPGLREPMATILVNHGDTVHTAMSEVTVAKSPLDQTDLFEVSKQISKDQDAYSIMNSGLNQAMVTDIHNDSQSDSTESLTRAGRTVGFLEEARIQAQGDPEVAEFKGKPLLDEAISYIPAVGDKVQQGVDYVSGAWLADEQKRLDEQATDNSVNAYKTRNGQLSALSEEWGRTHETSAADYVRMDTTEKSTESGIRHAQGVSGAGATQ